MAAGFILISDPETTIYKKLQIASGTSILAGTVLDRVRGSATVDAQKATASSTTSTIYAVAVSTASATDTTILAALITNRQVWSADAANTANAAHDGQRMIFGTQTITPGNATSILTSSGVGSIAGGTAFANVTTVNNTGSDVTGTTGVFEQLGLLGLVSTVRVVGRMLYEHAA